MDNNKKGPRRARRPKYYRLAYKIFFEEKRMEIINLRLRAYDESVERSQSQGQVHSNISLSQLAIDINQMWKDLSEQDHNTFKARAMIDMKRQRGAKKTDDSKQKAAPSQTQPDPDPASIRMVFATKATDDTLEAIVNNDPFDDGLMNPPSFDLNITPEPIMLWGDSLESKDPAPVQPNQEKQGDGDSANMPIVTRPAPNQSEHVAWTVHQEPTPTSATNNHLENVGLPPPYAYQHHVGGDQAFVVHNNIPLYWHPPQSNFAMGNIQNSNYLLGTSQLQPPLALAPTFTPSPYIVPGHNICNGPNVGYDSATFMHSSHGRYHPAYGHPPYSLPFYPPPSATAYYSTTGHPSVIRNSSTRLNGPLQGGIVDISQLINLKT